MRKIQYGRLFIFLVLILFLLAGCGGSGGSGDNASGFNPPGWIQGQWGVSGDNGTFATVFEFTNDNVIQYLPDTETKFSFKEIYKEVKENITSSIYEFTINNGTTTFSFRKNDGGSLAFENMTLIRKNE